MTFHKLVHIAGLQVGVSGGSSSRPLSRGIDSLRARNADISAPYAQRHCHSAIPSFDRSCRASDVQGRARKGKNGADEWKKRAG